MLMRMKGRALFLRLGLWLRLWRRRRWRGLLLVCGRAFGAFGHGLRPPRLCVLRGLCRGRGRVASEGFRCKILLHPTLQGM